MYIKDGKVLPKNKIVIIKDGRQYFNPQHDMLIAEGWVEYVEPIEEATEEYDKLAEIDNLKEALTMTDYKVIKCMEAYLCGEALPYDIEALHAERNAQRSEINKLEEV